VEQREANQPKGNRKAAEGSGLHEKYFKQGFDREEDQALQNSVRKELRRGKTGGTKILEISKTCPVIEGREELRV